MPSSSIGKYAISTLRAHWKGKLEEDAVLTIPLAANAHCEICIATAMWSL